MSLIKTLLKSVREYKKISIITPILVTFEAILDIIVPLLMAHLIDYGIQLNDRHVIIKYGIILLVVVLLCLCFGLASGYTSAVASTGFARNLRKDMFYKVQDFSFSNIDRFSMSSLITRITTDVTYLQNSYQMALRMAVRCPVMFIFSLVMCFIINPGMAWIFLCIVPVLGLGLYLLLSNAHPIFQRVFKAYDKLNLVVQENLSGIRVVKTFVREDHERKKFRDSSETIYKWFSKGEKLMAMNMPLMQLCIFSLLTLFSWFGAKQIIGENMSVGDFNSIITYAMSVLISLMMLSMVLLLMTIARPPAERVSEVLAEESDMKNPECPETEVRDGSIVFKNVGFAYSKEAEKPVLDNINIDIKSGETLGIIGGTGSSKTSLVQLIPRLYDVTEGEVEVGGVDVRRYDIQTLRDSVAMVLQKNVLFSGTIKENLKWGKADATDEEMVLACKLAQADGFISEFPDGYDTHIEQGGSNVSGGQKQRICIARALLKKPKILILDDSTSAVDTKTDALIRKSFSEYIPETTKIIIAQRAASVMEADKIIVMEEGKIDAIGTHEELLESNIIYQEVYYSQNREEDAS